MLCQINVDGLLSHTSTYMYMIRYDIRRLISAWCIMADVSFHHTPNTRITSRIQQRITYANNVHLYAVGTWW